MNSKYILHNTLTDKKKHVFISKIRLEDSANKDKKKILDYTTIHGDKPK